MIEVKTYRKKASEVKIMKITKLMASAVLLIATMSIIVAPFNALAVGGVEGDEYVTEIDSGWTNATSVLDGNIANGEYASAFVVSWYFEPVDYDTYQNETIYLYVMNDAEYLYIALDVCPDNVSDESDYITVLFDDDNNCVYEYTDPDYEGFYGIMEDNSTELNHALLWACGFQTTANCDIDHRIWELKIPLSNFAGGELELGDTVGMAIYGEYEEYMYPFNYTDWDNEDATNWSKVTLATVPPVPAEPTWTAQEIGLIMIGIGCAIIIIMTIFFRDFVLEYIGKGKDNIIMGLLAVAGILNILGILNIMYDWVGMILG